MEEIIEEQYFCQEEEDVERDGYEFEDASFAEAEED